MNAPFTAQGTPYAFEDDSWDGLVSINRKRRLFGLRAKPLPPIDEATAERLIDRAYDATFLPGGPSKDEYRREVEAIRAATVTLHRLEGLS